MTVTTTITQAHRDALSKAKIALMTKPDTVFFTTIVFSLKQVWDTTQPTAYTDGVEIGLNPDWFLSLSQEERVFLLVHEAMHVAYLHMDRLQERNKRKWNIAADHVINLQLLARGFKMPANGIADTQYADLSTEEVYRRLPDSPQQPMMDDLKAPASSADGRPSNLQQQVQDILVRAQLQSKVSGDKPGTIPGEIEVFLNKLLEPKLPWQTILRRFLKQFDKSDYTFRKPNRRFFPQYFLPSLRGEKLVNLAIGVDASGSVSDQEFTAMVTETHSILRRMKPDRITLIPFDTKLRTVETIRNVTELMRVSFTGRGGTRIKPILDWANETRPQALLIFTDGEFTFPAMTCAVPVIWLIHDNPRFTAPFGQIIHYEV